jgi:CcmD family protein
MNNLVYVVVAYAVIWAIIFGYLLFIDRRVARLTKELAHLRDALERHQSK